jgi:hypothetical protein
MATAPEKLDPAETLSTSTAPLGRFGDSIEYISGQLSEHGAMALSVIDGEAIAKIERRFGVETHRITTERFAALVMETCSARLEPEDLVVWGALGADAIYLFLFRSRSDDRFYRKTRAQIAHSIGESIAAAGNRIVYPYLREMPMVPIGCCVAIRNPGLSEERQIRETVDRAREDAKLNARIESRTRAQKFLDLVLTEDVTTLYEPIVNLTTREPIGYQALSRGPWDSNLHAPDILFEMGERSGLVYELDCLCRRKALQGAHGLKPGKLLFLNCLPTAIHDPAFRGEVLKTDPRRTPLAAQ